MVAISGRSERNVYLRKNTEYISFNKENKSKHLQELDCFKDISSRLGMHVSKSSPKEATSSFLYRYTPINICSLWSPYNAGSLSYVVSMREPPKQNAYSLEKVPTGQNYVQPSVKNSHLYPAALFYLCNREHAAHVIVFRKALHIDILFLWTSSKYLECWP